MLSFVAEELVELSVAGRTGAANAMTPNKQGAAAALGTLSLASTALPLAATATPHHSHSTRCLRIDL